MLMFIETSSRGSVGRAYPSHVVPGPLEEGRTSARGFCVDDCAPWPGCTFGPTSTPHPRPAVQVALTPHARGRPFRPARNQPGSREESRPVPQPSPGAPGPAPALRRPPCDASSEEPLALRRGEDPEELAVLGDRAPRDLDALGLLQHLDDLLIADRVRLVFLVDQLLDRLLHA